jgi:hypothetical protein
VELVSGILVNLVSDFLFAGILVFVAWLLYASTDRRRLQKFFGVSESKTIYIYLSNIEVLRGGSLGADGNRRSFFGPTVVLAELECAERFRAIFSPLVPLTSGDPGLLGKVLLSDIAVNVLPSPSRGTPFSRNGPVVSIGSHGYNTVSMEIEALEGCMAHFVDDNSSIQLQGLPNLLDPRLGFVTRVRDPKTQCTYFQVAGAATIGTEGAALYLASQWKRLYRRFGSDRNFVVVLKFDARDKYSIVHESEGA